MNKFLVLTDFSEKAEQAAIWALHIAAHTGASILLVHFYSPNSQFPLETGRYNDPDDQLVDIGEIEESLQKLAVRLSLEFVQNFGMTPPEIDITSRPEPMIGKLSKLIDEKNIDLIFMGGQSQDEFLQRMLFGKDSHTVIEESTCPVMLVPEGYSFKKISKVLFATDLEPLENDGLGPLREIALLWGSAIKLLYITRTELSDSDRAALESRFHFLSQTLRGMRVMHEFAFGIDITETLCNCIDEENAELLVLVHKKRSRIGQFIHKSVSKAMINYSQVPLLILRK